MISQLRGATRIVQCVRDSVHERETCFGYKIYGFFMEYAAGGTLDAKIKTHHRGLPMAIISSFTRMILIVLRALHGAGFVHGDLHSCNVLLFSCKGAELEEEKVSDFGLAKRVGEDNGWWSHENKFLGVADYMSPESGHNGMLLAAHDIWAVGCLVLKMFTNKPPWPKNYGPGKIKYFLSCNTTPY